MVYALCSRVDAAMGVVTTEDGTDTVLSTGRPHQSVELQQQSVKFIT